jgi:hypothetical protein
VRFLGRRDSVHDQILAHYKKFWADRKIDEVHWTPGPMAARLPDFHIAKIPPGGATNFWTCASIGAWRATEHHAHGLEFVVVSRSESASVLERLAMTAFYHAGPDHQRLGVGHTVPIGEGWVDGSPLDTLLVSLPYLWGPALEHCKLADRQIQVLWLILIYAIERDFKRENGLDALEARFEAVTFDYLDPFRQAVVLTPTA